MRHERDRKISMTKTPSVLSAHRRVAHFACVFCLTILLINSIQLTKCDESYRKLPRHVEKGE